jgi:hypothetical protein
MSQLAVQNIPLALAMADVLLLVLIVSGFLFALRRRRMR